MFRVPALLITLALLVAASFIAAPISRAVTTEQGQLKPDDSSLYNLVSMDCLDVKFKLNEVHRQDKLLRVTVGQGYDNMSSHLMARLNARIVESRLDGAELIKIAAEFEDAREKFRDDYTKYDDSFVVLLKSDCQSQIQTYYVGIQNTKQLRATVYEDIRALDQIMQRYYEAFTDFRNTLSDEEKKKVNNE
jgi:hypothetical protein